MKSQGKEKSPWNSVGVGKRTFCTELAGLLETVTDSKPGYEMLNYSDENKHPLVLK
jgi:hypothetical protein